MKKSLLFMFIFLLLLINLSAIELDHRVVIEVNNEDGSVPADVGVEFEIWLNDDRTAEHVYDETEVTAETYRVITTTEDHGMLDISVPNYLSGAGYGDELHVWVKDTDSIEEGLMTVQLGYSTPQQFLDNNSLVLVSTIVTIAANTSAAEDYVFNSGRDNAVDCTVSIQSPAGTTGDITVGLMNAIPSTLPVSGQAINLCFYFDVKDLTAGEGNFNVSVNWDNTDVALDSSSDPDLFISEDGLKWINTDNYANGTSNFNWSTGNRATDEVTFDIDHVPHSIVFGDGEGTYTESTPDVPEGQTVTMDGSDMTLEWIKAELPGAVYTIETNTSAYASSGWTTVSETIGTSGNKKNIVITQPADEYRFYRVKAANNSGQSSNWCTVFGFRKYSLVSGWNMIGYPLGADELQIKKLYNDGISGTDEYGDIATIATNNAVKKWNKTTQSWVTYGNAATATISKGDILMINTTGAPTWYSTGMIDSDSNPYQYTLNYQSGVSGYNAILLPLNKTSITTTADLYDDIFGTPKPTAFGRTISWYDNATDSFLTYDDGPLGTEEAFDSVIKAGVPLIIHVRSTDNITWPQ
ncbi:MAG: hypothetical protein K9M99_11845 [Candidatus Cloacimonetes bacterium]|nr:hypothetical protein [Candidatus Cloacimonadota bacterium]